MELTSKQRAQLRGLANSIDTILIVGKDGIGDNLVKQANDALEARELIKGRVLENSLMSAREAAEALLRWREKRRRADPTNLLLIVLFLWLYALILFARSLGGDDVPTVSVYVYLAM